ncbi:MAG: hypothetical protein IPI33_15835 [Dehalococcoidia bacterium]|nr:hypothetical protein [Dehalococcoidia bacterium]
MTNPEREEESILPEAEAFEDEPAENPILGWAKAIVFGIGDTAKDVLAEGRRGAREAMEDSWDRFDQKTKHRRS